MNLLILQTRTALKAASVGFVLSVIVIGYSWISKRQKPDFVSPDAAIISYWATPIICAVGAIIYRFSEVPWRTSVVNLLAAIIGIPLLCGVFASAIVALYPAPELPELPFATAGPRRDLFVKGAVGNCLQSLRGRVENRIGRERLDQIFVTDETLAKYCQCRAETLADLTTKQLYDSYTKSRTFPPEAMLLATTASNKCIELAPN